MPLLRRRRIRVGRAAPRRSRRRGSRPAAKSQLCLASRGRRSLRRMEGSGPRVPRGRASRRREGGPSREEYGGAPESVARGCAAQRQGAPASSTAPARSEARPDLVTSTNEGNYCAGREFPPGTATQWSEVGGAGLRGGAARRRGRPCDGVRPEQRQRASKELRRRWRSSRERERELRRGLPCRRGEKPPETVGLGPGQGPTGIGSKRRILGLNQISGL